VSQLTKVISLFVAKLINMPLPRNGFALNDDEIQSLIDLGLTSSQAKVYFALLKIGCSRARTASKFSKVVRQDIYRILEELKKLGLVAKTLDKPTKFEPIPLEDGLAILCDRKNKEISEMHRKASELLKKFPEKEKHMNAKEEVLFELFPLRATSELAGKEAVDAAEISIKSVTPWTWLKPMIPINLKRYKQAFERGVEIYILTDKPDAEQIPNPLETLLTNPLFQIGYIPQVGNSFVIVDDKMALIQIDIENFLNGGNLKTNNPAIVRMVKDYFEMMWDKALEAPAKNCMKKVSKRKTWVQTERLA
jgi:sugar-specific transcriptional regulator TrmB